MTTHLPVCLISATHPWFFSIPRALYKLFFFLSFSSLCHLCSSFSFSLTYFCPLCLTLPIGYRGLFLMKTLDLSRCFTEAQYCIIYHSAQSCRQRQPQRTGNKFYYRGRRLAWVVGGETKGDRDADGQKWRLKCGRERHTEETNRNTGQQKEVKKEEEVFFVRRQCKE